MSTRCHDCACHVNPPCWACVACRHVDHPECDNPCDECTDHEDDDAAPPTDEDQPRPGAALLSTPREQDLLREVIESQRPTTGPSPVTRPAGYPFTPEFWKYPEAADGAFAFRRRCGWCHVVLRAWQMNTCRRCTVAKRYSPSPPCPPGSRADARPDTWSRR